MSQNYLAEAFQKLEMLNEDTFNVTDDGVDKLALFLDGDNTEELTILDAEAETVDDLETNYIGKVILDCNVCHTKCYEDKENVVIDEETQCANVDQECAYCHCMDGFKVVGQVAEYSDTPATEEPIEDSEADSTLEESLTEPALAEDDEDLEEDINVQQTGKAKIGKFFDIKSNDKTGYYQYENEDGSRFGPHAKSEDELKNWLKTASREDIEKTVEEPLKYVSSTEHTNSNNNKTDLNEGIFDKKPKEVSSSKLTSVASAELDPVLAKYTKDWTADSGSMHVPLDLAEKITKIMTSDRKRFTKDFPANTGGIKAYYSNVTYNKSPNPGSDSKNPTTLLRFSGLRKEDKKTVEYIVFINTKKGPKELGRSKNHLEIPDLAAKAVKKDPTATVAKRVNGRREKDLKAKDVVANPRLLKEDLNHISVETDDSTMEINHDENGSVSVTTTPNTQASGEMIAPVDDTLEADIMANGEEPVDDTPIEDEVTEEDAPAEGEEETLDSAEEFVEESFDTLVGKYLTRVYENVNKYKTKKITAKNNQYVVEGLIKFNSGKIKPTTFLFECKNNTLVGKNSQLARNRKAFTVKGRIQEKKFIAESFNYNYKAPVDGKPTRVYGTIKG